MLISIEGRVGRVGRVFNNFNGKSKYFEFIQQQYFKKYFGNLIRTLKKPSNPPYPFFTHLKPLGFNSTDKPSKNPLHTLP